MKRQKRLSEALKALVDLGMPRAQQNDRSALCLLSLLDLSPEKSWADAGNPLMGITPIMEWSKKYYKRNYAPNTRETFRRQTMHQFVEGGIALYNPDVPGRAVNSPNAVYQIEPNLLTVMRKYGSPAYRSGLVEFFKRRPKLIEKYAMARDMRMIPVIINNKMKIDLSAGKHSELIKKVIEEFAPRFVPGAVLVYVGDTGDKWGGLRQ